MFTVCPTFLRTAAIALMALAATGILLAHEGGSHMSGVIAAVDAKAGTLTLQDGKQATVINLTKTTKYVKEKKSAAVSDLKTGLRAVVHVQLDEKTKKYTAEEVEIGVAEPASSSAASSPKK